MLRGLRLGFLTIALVAACSAGPQAKVICEYRDTLSDGECQWAAQAVLDSVGAAHPAAVVVVYAVSGCIGFCPFLVGSAGPPRRGALVFVRFSDGAPSIEWWLNDLSQKHPLVSASSQFDPDGWIDAAEGSHGTSVTSIAIP
ncbi:MAG: hypothetical protein E6J47_06710 [Chloroflexi bacterium]|nr:MAG: hypothetical protein E6J47_06710 [Chloroflexota bacterium]